MRHGSLLSARGGDRVALFLRPAAHALTAACYLSSLSWRADVDTAPSEEKTHLNAGQRHVRTFRSVRSCLARHLAAEAIPPTRAAGRDHHAEARRCSIGPGRPS